MNSNLSGFTQPNKDRRSTSTAPWLAARRRVGVSGDMRPGLAGGTSAREITCSPDVPGWLVSEPASARPRRAGLNKARSAIAQQGNTKRMKTATARTAPLLLHPFDDLVVGFMRTDPAPPKEITLAIADHPIIKPNPRCPGFADLFELQRRMKRIVFKEFILLIGQILNLFRQFCVELPETVRGDRLEGHPVYCWAGRPSLNGLNLPARASAFISSRNGMPAPPG